MISHSELPKWKLDMVQVRIFLDVTENKQDKSCHLSEQTNDAKSQMFANALFDLKIKHSAPKGNYTWNYGEK